MSTSSNMSSDLATRVLDLSPVQCMLLVIVGAGLVLGVKSLLQIGQRGKNLPPGPPTIPLFGNEHQIPAADAHFQFKEWASQYGPIFSLKRFHNTTLVITDPKLVKALVDKKSNIYSHRPASTVAHFITHSDHLLVMQYSDIWRKVRKIVHQYFMESKCDAEHWKVQEAEATQMLHDYMVAPQDLMLHPKRYSNSITNSLVFGIRTKTVRDDYMEKLYALMGEWSLVMEVGSTPAVDSFSPLRYIPQWLLGNWKNRALDVNRMMTSLYTTVLDQVIERREAGVHRNSFIDQVLNQQEKNQLTRSQLLFLGGVLMEGGSDTSSSLTLTLVQAMTKYPRVQARAQAEIDAVIGSDRSPCWSDFPKLPYINMIIKELHRWRPVSPLGVSHALAEDDEINGMHLPKGSTVILNVWGMHHDPANYKHPEDFYPEHFEDYPLLAPAYAAAGPGQPRDHFGYGAGRRICPGIHLAERNLFIGVSKLLWAFDFSEPEGVSSDIDPRTGLSQGFLHAPKDYECVVTLRGEDKRKTIMKEMEAAREVFKQYE